MNKISFFVRTRILFRQIKSRISSLFKIEKIKKRNRIIRESKNNVEDILRQLKKQGFYNITKCSIYTWKYYNNGDNLRITFSAFKNGKKYFLKVSKNFQMVKNSISFYKYFNDVFDFIPKGGEILLDGYDCYYTEFIDCYSFYELTPYLRINIDRYLLEIMHILNELDKYKLVHRDLETYNIFFSKKDLKLYLFDFDTCYCEKYKLDSDYVLDNLVNIIDGKVYFDDAFSFLTIIDRLKILGIEENYNYKNIKAAIGRNTYKKSK